MAAPKVNIVRLITRADPSLLKGEVIGGKATAKQRLAD
jgi:hypothetical protein